MERNNNAPRGGYSAHSYIQALKKKGYLPYWRHSQLFMHDNVRVHTDAVTRKFLHEQHINTIDWPAYSPDLNPIEHLWWHLKKRMYKLYPQYNNCSKAEEEWDGFCEALKARWHAIPGKLIKRSL
jgi:transposase